MYSSLNSVWERIEGSEVLHERVWGKECEKTDTQQLEV